MKPLGLNDEARRYIRCAVLEKVSEPPQRLRRVFRQALHRLAEQSVSRKPQGCRVAHTVVGNDELEVADLVAARLRGMWWLRGARLTLCSANR